MTSIFNLKILLQENEFLSHFSNSQFTLQQYVDDLFRSILRADTKQTRCIKWLFDFFDDSASSQDISDPQVVHTWKSNR